MSTSPSRGLRGGSRTGDLAASFDRTTYCCLIRQETTMKAVVCLPQTNHVHTWRGRMSAPESAFTVCQYTEKYSLSVPTGPAGWKRVEHSTRAPDTPMHRYRSHRSWPRLSKTRIKPQKRINQEQSFVGCNLR